MSKYRLLTPFIILAAVSSALPLTHGCSDSSVECLGMAVACGNREISECTAGCSVREGCIGSTVDCASLTDEPNLCVQTAGCRYLGSCDGAEGCEDSPLVRNAARHDPIEGADPIAGHQKKIVPVRIDVPNFPRVQQLHVIHPS